MVDLNTAWQGFLNGAWLMVAAFAVLLIAFCGVLSLLAVCGIRAGSQSAQAGVDSASSSARWNQFTLPPGV